MNKLPFMLVCLIPCTLLAQGTSSGLAQLKLPFAPRPAALGESTVADESHLASVALNPANIVSDDAAILFSHTEWIQDVRTEFLAARAPLSFATLGLTVISTSIKGIEIRERPGPSVGTFTAQASVFGLTAGSQTVEGISAGISLKYVYEKIYVDEATGFSADLGVLARTPMEGLTAGLSVTNLGKMGTLRNERTELPARIQGGATYAMNFRDFAVRVSPAVVFGLNTSAVHGQLGIEGSYQKFLSLRLGYQTGYEIRGLSAGVGIVHEFVALDYALVPFSEGLGNAHMIAIGVRF
jgi:hypothetical protein